MDVKVRGLDEEIGERIRSAAAASGVSVEGHLRQLLIREYGSVVSPSRGVQVDSAAEVLRLDREVEALKSEVGVLNRLVDAVFPRKRKEYGGRVDEVDYAE